MNKLIVLEVFSTETRSFKIKESYTFVQLLFAT